MIRFYIKMFFYAQFGKLRKKFSFEIWSNKNIRLFGNLPFNPGHTSSHICSSPCFCFLIIWDIVISPVCNTALRRFQLYFIWISYIFLEEYGTDVSRSGQLKVDSDLLYLLPSQVGQGHHISASDHPDLKRQNCLSLSFFPDDRLHFLTQSNYSICHYLWSLRLYEIFQSLSLCACIYRERALDLKQAILFSGWP